MKHTICIATLLTLSSLSPLAQADNSASEPLSVARAATTAARGLSPDQITAIRKVGRNVLAAKKSGQDDGADAAELASLRASVESLITAELPAGDSDLVTQMESARGEPTKARQNRDGRRALAHNKALELVSQLRRRAERKSAQLQSVQEAPPHSAGMPLGEQRARLLERLTNKLDEALSAEGPDRASHLRELSRQLQGSVGSVREAPLNRETPMLQAMPSNFVPPKDKDLQFDDAQAATQQGN